MPTASPEPVAVLRGHSAPVNAVAALSTTSIVSGAADGSVKLWSLTTRRETATIQAHSKAGVLHVASLHDGRVITHGRDGYVKLWDAECLSNAKDPLMSWYCGSFTFTKATPARWASSSADSHLIACPADDEKDVRRSPIAFSCIVMVTYKTGVDRYL
ncbi:hypothetical protein PINS_up001688 [Pythium insidiosum]|nr:hypothetical protein PINS_up001688 [Pythium insidiosum]